MLKVYFKNDPSQICTIRPTPLVQISEAILKNKEGNFGVTYTITLTGSLLPNEGTPYALDPANNQVFDLFSGSLTGLVGPYQQFDMVATSARSRPPKQKVNKPEAAIFSKQRDRKSVV